MTGKLPYRYKILKFVKTILSVNESGVYITIEMYLYWEELLPIVEKVT
jgi:hypothetical protein